MSRRGKRLREFAELVTQPGPGEVEAALEVLDYIREAYGKSAGSLGGGVYGLYSIALMYALSRDREKLRTITLLLSEVLESMAEGDEARARKAREMLKKVLDELEDLTNEAVGG